MSFTCAVCGERHDERMLDIRAELPDAVFELGKRERRKRTDVGDDWCVLDGARFFVRGLVELPVATLGDDFRFGAWVEVGQDDFVRLGDLWSDPAGKEQPPFTATLANELRPYERTVGLPALLRLADVERLPSIEILDAEHPLGRDQHRGIDESVVDRLAAAVLHP